MGKRLRYSIFAVCLAVVVVLVIAATSVPRMLLGRKDPVIYVAVGKGTMVLGLKDAIELGWNDGGSLVPITKFVSRYKRRVGLCYWYG